MSDLTEAEQEVVFAAWALAARGKSFVPNESHLSACRSMESKGWLRSEPAKGDDLAFAWTAEGEAALQLSALMDDRAAEAD